MHTKQLRILSTVLLAFAVAQAGLGSGFLDGRSRALLVAHATNAFAVVVLSILSAVFGLAFRRAGAAGWTFYLPLALAVASVVQLLLGFAGVLGGHVFWGVLYLCAVTTFCSYTWRLLPADAPRPTARAARPHAGGQ